MKNSGAVSEMDIAVKFYHSKGSLHVYIGSSVMFCVISKFVVYQSHAGEGHVFETNGF